MLLVYIQVLCGMKNSINPKIETGYAFTTDMNKKPVKKFNTGIFTQGSPIKK